MKLFIKKRWILVILEKKVLSFGVLIKPETKDMSTSKRGAFYYKFDHLKYNELATKSINFEI